MDKFLEEFVGKTFSGSGFAGVSPEQKNEFRPKLLRYFSDLIFDTLLDNLTDDQLKELQEMPDLGSPEAQEKIALMSGSIPGFIFTLEDVFEKAASEIGKTGNIPEPSTAPVIS